MRLGLEAARTVYTGGNIYTVDSGFSKASVIAVGGDRILYAGNDLSRAYGIAGESAAVVDLGGKTVIPGLIDGHMHLLPEGLQTLTINALRLSKQEILRLVGERARTLAPGEWIRGSGWNHMEWAERQWPSKEDLDAAAPDNPVILHRADMHSIWVNSKALEAAGIGKNTQNPHGGEILRTPEGDLLGIFVDTARDLICNALPPYSGDMKIKALLAAQEECFGYGLTSVFDAGCSFEDLCLLKAAYESGKFKLRVCQALTASDGSDAAYLDAGFTPSKGLYGGRLSVGAVKIFADGSIGSGSALFFDDYADRPGHKGYIIHTDDELYGLVSRACKAGFQVSIHAIGDMAIRQALDAYERAGREVAGGDPRFRVEHFQIPAPSDVRRAVSLGVVTTLQAGGALTDMEMMEGRLGTERVRTAYVWRGLIDAGGYIVGGSDACYDSLNPFHGLYAGTAGGSRNGCMTREESLRSYTIWAAKGQFEENDKGSLEAGKLADFAVLDRDIMTCDPAGIRETKVLATILGGETVFMEEKL